MEARWYSRRWSRADRLRERSNALLRFTDTQMGAAEKKRKKTSNRKPIVVTGAAGFIGRNTVAALNERGIDNLLLVDSLGKDEKWRNLVGLRFENLLKPDQFLDLVATKKSCPEVDAVIHLGACSSTTETNADFLLANNYQYTRTLCEWCLGEG